MLKYDVHLRRFSFDRDGAFRIFRRCRPVRVFRHGKAEIREPEIHAKLHVVLVHALDLTDHRRFVIALYFFASRDRYRVSLPEAHHLRQLIRGYVRQLDGIRRRLFVVQSPVHENRLFVHVDRVHVRHQLPVVHPCAPVPYVQMQLPGHQVSHCRSVIKLCRLRQIRDLLVKSNDPVFQIDDLFVRHQHHAVAESHQLRRLRRYGVRDVNAVICDPRRRNDQHRPVVRVDLRCLCRRRNIVSPLLPHGKIRVTVHRHVFHIVNLAVRAVYVVPQSPELHLLVFSDGCQVRHRRQLCHFLTPFLSAF